MLCYDVASTSESASNGSETEDMPKTITMTAFDLFDDVLCLSHAPMAIVSGTRSTAFSGKSSLIPALFSSPQSNGVGCVQSINKSRLNANKNNVDVLIDGNEAATDPAKHTSPPWIIVDFHSSVESEPARRLLKACAAHATLHIVHASATADFVDADVNGCLAISDELVDLLDYYAAIYPSQSSSPPTRLIVLLRDVNCSSPDHSEYDLLDEEEENANATGANMLVQRIEQALLQRYPWATDCIKLVRFESSTTNNNNDEEHLFRQKQLASEVNALIGQWLTGNKGWKSLRSMNEVRRTFGMLTSVGNNRLDTVSSDKFNMELEFDRLFEQVGAGATVATIDVKRMFPLAYKNRELNECKERLNRVGYETREGDEAVRQLARLKNERLRLQPLSPHIMFFVRLLLRHSSNNSSSSSNGTNRSAKRSQCGDDDDGGELAPWTSQSSFIGDVNEFETRLVQWKSGPLKLLKQER